MRGGGSQRRIMSTAVAGDFAFPHLSNRWSKCRWSGLAWTHGPAPPLPTTRSWRAPGACTPRWTRRRPPTRCCMTTRAEGGGPPRAVPGADRLHGLRCGCWPWPTTWPTTTAPAARPPGSPTRPGASHGAAVGAGRVADALEHRWHRVARRTAGRHREPRAGAGHHPGARRPAGRPRRRTSVDRAEAYLVEQAAAFDPRHLRILGRKVLEVVAPEVAEDHERRALEDEERRARRTTRLTFRRRGDGTTEIHARVSDAVAGRLRTYLEAFASPRRDRAGVRAGPDPADRRPSAAGGAAGARVLRPARGAAGQGSPPPRWLGHDPGRHHPARAAAPGGGRRRRRGRPRGTRATLRHRGAAAGLHGPDRARRPRRPCPAAAPRPGPAPLQRRPAPGDGGPRRHLPRRGVRHPRRLVRGAPPPRPWVRGGLTDLEDGVLLCSFHHHRAHDADYAADLHAGRLRFSRRARVG